MPNRIGPEDLPEWKDMAPDVKTPVVLTCRVCKKAIKHWHCGDSGCSWCADCGAACEARKEKKK